MQQMLRQVLVRPSSTRAREQGVTAPARRAPNAGRADYLPPPSPPSPLEPPRSTPALRIQTAPAALCSTSWPMAAQDTAQHESFLALMYAFDHKVRVGAPHKEVQVSRLAALQGVNDYQQYLRSRMVDVSVQLQDFKELRKAVIAASPPMQDILAMFRDINGPEVFSRSHGQSPFETPEVMRFLAQQEAREEALEDAIGRRMAAIRRNHSGVLTVEKYRERLMEEALAELVEKDLIQYYLEMTLLTRCQLTAKHLRTRLSTAGQP